jgi:hypothetical protein
MRTIKTYFKGAPFYNAFLRSGKLQPCETRESISGRGSANYMTI